MKMQRYAITDRRLLFPHPGGMEAALCNQLQQWVAGGIEWVQIREKDLPEHMLAALARSLAAVAHGPGSSTKLLVNGLRPELARECGADGVHLPSGADAEAICAAARDAGMVTVSCHGLQEVEVARRGGAAAVLWAPVFSKAMLRKTIDPAAGKATTQEAMPDEAIGAEPVYREVHPGSGLPALHAACLAAAPMPVFALGGVSITNAPVCLEAGAAGIAGIRLFHGSTWRVLA